MKLIKNSPYIRFLNAIDSVDEINPFLDLSVTETALLNFIFKVIQSGKELQVGGIVTQTQLGSQATLHSRVYSLISQGYIELSLNKVDKRKKYIRLTKKAYQYEAFMSECLLKANKQPLN